MTGIIVLGSLMQDLVVRVARLPVPGETIFAGEFAEFVGGKGGNQALAAARLGSRPVTMVGRVGCDLFGDRVIETLSSAGVDCSLVVRDPEQGTGVAIPMVLADGTNAIISTPRANLAVSGKDVEAAWGRIRGADMLVLQLEVGMEANLAAASFARGHGVPVLLNAAPVNPHPPALLALADVLVVNEVEADALAPAPGDRLEQARQLRLLGPRVAIITLGHQGAVYAAADGEGLLPAFAVRPVDTVGAGDAFCGALAVALVEGMHLTTAMRFASAAGALAVTRAGAAASIPGRTEVDALLASGPGGEALSGGTIFPA